METNYDALTEMKFAENRFKYRGNQYGAPENKHKCFICGEKSKNGNGICEDCEMEFPSKRSKSDL